MIYLLSSLIVILLVYIFLMYLTFKRYMPWKYKGSIYGTLTFFMIICVFLTFEQYDKYWKRIKDATDYSYNANFLIQEDAIEAITSDKIGIPLVVANKSNYVWHSKKNQTVISYHLLDLQKRIVQFDFIKI